MRPGSAPIWTISHTLACRGSTPVHLVRAAIEHEELSEGRLLKPGRLAEASCKVSGNRVDRAEHFRIECHRAAWSGPSATMTTMIRRTEGL